MPWSCTWSPCPRYTVGAAIAAGDKDAIASMVVVRRGMAFCSECGAAQVIPEGAEHLLPADAKDAWPISPPM